MDKRNHLLVLLRSQRSNGTPNSKAKASERSCDVGTHELSLAAEETFGMLMECLAARWPSLPLFSRFVGYSQ
ncbi:hypothetical protein V6N12_034965 [Hibiscus sabdariffa]|uniref:Uncharacterized protein n=1 Tax=Hibiscus sabdariffa TaxID=183260 RepID=A0ABR2BNX8_9ROSI